MTFKTKLKQALGMKVEPYTLIAEKIAKGEKDRLKKKAESEVLCDYCHQPAEAVTGEEVYPHREDLFHLKFYVCEPCDARVGCHVKTGKPYGRLANAQLRRAKCEAHESFDKLWKGSGRVMSRPEAYRWLAEVLDIDQDEAHIGKFDEETCRKVVEVVTLEFGFM